MGTWDFQLENGNSQDAPTSEEFTRRRLDEENRIQGTPQSYKTEKAANLMTPTSRWNDFETELREEREFLPHPEDVHRVGCRIGWRKNNSEKREYALCAAQPKCFPFRVHFLSRRKVAGKASNRNRNGDKCLVRKASSVREIQFIRCDSHDVDR